MRHEEFKVGRCPDLAGLAVHDCYVIRMLVDPVFHVLAEVKDVLEYWADGMVECREQEASVTRRTSSAQRRSGFWRREAAPVVVVKREASNAMVKLFDVITSFRTEVVHLRQNNNEEIVVLKDADDDTPT